MSQSGTIKKFFQDAMERYSRQLADGEIQKVGANVHEISREEDTLLRDVTEKKIEPYRERIEAIKEYKSQRDKGLVDAVLDKVRSTARSESGNIMYPIVEATEAGATMGEIAGMLRMAYDFPYDPHGMIEPPV